MSGDLVVFQVDGIYGTAEAAVQEIAHDDAAHAAGPVRCPDEGDGRRVKELVEIQYAHGCDVSAGSAVQGVRQSPAMSLTGIIATLGVAMQKKVR